MEDYFALVGLPTVGIPSTAKSNFTLESSYLSLGCAKPVKSVYTKSLWNQTVGQIWNGLTTNGKSSNTCKHNCLSRKAYLVDQIRIR